MSRKFSGGWIIFNILGAAALFIVLIVGANMLLKVITKHNQEIRVPDLTGMSVDEAGQYLSARGMRMEITDSVYIKRMETLEKIATDFDGVERAYAIQAGREIRIIVKPEVVDDAGTVFLAKEVAKQIESEMEYPGQIKVNVVRELRSTEYAK